MEPFLQHTGIVASLDRVNVDTDQIVPKQFLKRIERTGFGEFLFFDWRFKDDGSLNTEFELNLPGYEGASILATGRNFGSGSSREHASWALQDYGFRCIIATSLADIFHKNCMENGLVPVLLPDDDVRAVISGATERPGYQVTVDLEQCQLWGPEGVGRPFVVHPDPETHEFRRHCLMNGLDDIALTLRHEDKIIAFEARRGSYGV